MKLSTNVHHAESIELILSADRYAALEGDDQPESEWLDIVITTDEGEFEVTVFGAPAIKWGETDDVMAAISELRDEMVGMTEANADLVEARLRARDGRRAAEDVCDALRADIEQLREDYAGSVDAHMFTTGQLAEANAELHAANQRVSE